jgi:hypothetical protein
MLKLKTDKFEEILVDHSILISGCVSGDIPTHLFYNKVWSIEKDRTTYKYICSDAFPILLSKALTYQTLIGIYQILLRIRRPREYRVKRGYAVMIYVDTIVSAIINHPLFNPGDLFDPDLTITLVSIKAQIQDIFNTFIGDMNGEMDISFRSFKLLNVAITKSNVCYLRHGCIRLDNLDSLINCINGMSNDEANHVISLIKQRNDCKVLYGNGHLLW